MIKIRVDGAIKTMRSAASQLTDKQLAKSISRAINDSILVGRTEARSAVKGLYNMPQRYLSGININRSNTRSLTASIYASSKPIPMDAFGAKFQTATKSLSISRRGEQRETAFKRIKKNPAAGVSIEVLKGKRERVPFAFMISGAKPRVFARGEYKNGTAYGFVQRNKRIQSSGSDSPIKPLISVTVHGAVINKDAMKKIEGKVNSVFPVAIERNVSFLVSQIKGQG